MGEVNNYRQLRKEATLMTMPQGNPGIRNSTRLCKRLKLRASKPRQSRQPRNQGAWTAYTL